MFGVNPGSRQPDIICTQYTNCCFLQHLLKMSNSAVHKTEWKRTVAGFCSEYGVRASALIICWGISRVAIELLFFLALLPSAGYGLLVHEVF
jgi:hypothetical protein